MAQAKAKSKPEKNRKNIKADSEDPPSKFVPMELKKEPEVKKARDSDIVKKVFLKKFEAQQRQAGNFSDSDVDVESKHEEEEEDEEGEKEKPSLKLKFSRKESSSEASHFEVSNDNLSEEKFDDTKDTSSLSAILRNLNSDRQDSKPPQLPLMSPPKEREKPTKAADNRDDSSDDEVVPQKSFRLHSFIESLRAMQARLPQKKDDAAPKIDIPEHSREDQAPLKPSLVSPGDSSADLKNKWLQSLENRSKVKPPDPTPVANKIQTDIAMLKDKNSLIYSKAKLKSYPENLPKLPLLKAEVKAEEVKVKEERKKPAPVKQKSGRNVEKVEYHDARPSLRKGKMIPCPICGSEYAIADNLQKHIDKDHFGETDRVFLKRVKPKDTKEKEKTEPSKKKKKISNMTSFDDDEDDLFVDLRPTIDKTTAEEKFDSLIAGSSSKERREETPVEEEKLTEYEIFQKLQLKETSKTEKKKVECKECGMMLPVNTIKRHLLKHEKEAQMEEAGEEMEEAPVKAEKPKAKAGRNKKVGCSHCEKPFPPHTIKRHEVKCRKEKEKEKEKETEKKQTEEFVDDRIPCPHCSKMFPKLVMKRHLMKHETVSESSDTERVEVEVEEKTEKVVKTRKKVNCSECGLAVAPNVLKRHLDKHSKLREKSKSEDNSEMFAPIEITPTKEYWEFEKEKTNKSLDFPSESEHSAEEADVPPPPYKKIRKDLRKSKKSDSELRNKSLAEVKEAEKSRHTSEEESESENPLEAAVRKVVSYRMTPKQALSHYNLTPKVLFDNLLGETDEDRMSILGKVSLEADAEKKVITYCRENETELSYKAVVSLVKDLKISEGQEEFSLSRLEAYRWWYAFRKKHDLKITAKKK